MMKPRPLRLVSLALSLLSLPGCCGPPPEPLPPNLVYVPQDLLDRLEAIRTALHLHSTKNLIGDALAGWEFQERQSHDIRPDDCADAPDSGEWHVHFCPDIVCGHLDENACISRFRPPCEPGLTFVPTSAESGAYGHGTCRAVGDMGRD